MTFEEFCRAHGLILEHAIADGNWHRCKTTDKAGSSRNGTYKFKGDVGFCQNYRTMPKVAVWKPDQENKPTPIDARKLAEAQARADKQMEERYAKAAKTAADILQHSVIESHPYLEKKRFGHLKGNVYLGDIVKDGHVHKKIIEHSGLATTELLVVPMRSVADYSVQSVQLIDRYGKKIFLPGGRAAGSIYKIGEATQARYRWFVEGFATGLSVRAGLESLSFSGQVVICFSAGNMLRVIEHYKRRSPRPGMVFADHDKPNLEFPARGEAGQNAAKEAGLPWIMSPNVGEDANDYHERCGIIGLAGLMRKVYADL